MVRVAVTACALLICEVWTLVPQVLAYWRLLMFVFVRRMILLTLVSLVRLILLWAGLY